MFKYNMYIWFLPSVFCYYLRVLQTYHTSYDFIAYFTNDINQDIALYIHIDQYGIYEVEPEYYHSLQHLVCDDMTDYRNIGTNQETQQMTYQWKVSLQTIRESVCLPEMNYNTVSQKYVK